MVIVGLGDTLGVIAVEGKVEESFADLIGNWNTSASKQCRLDGLCATFCLDAGRVGNIRYQLLHRTASAVYEAKRYRSHQALMLVHSFSNSHRWSEGFAAFSIAMGLPIVSPGVCSAPKLCEGVNLRLAWVADTPQVR